MERETAADPESANIECSERPGGAAHRDGPGVRAAGGEAADEHAAADSDDDDDDGAPLQLPSQQTRAVADAVKAGRTLISEVAEGGEGGEDGEPPPPAGWKRKSDADDGDGGPPQNWREGGTSDAARARPAKAREAGRRRELGKNRQPHFLANLFTIQIVKRPARNDGRRKGGCRHAHGCAGAGAARLAAGRALARPPRREASSALSDEELLSLMRPPTPAPAAATATATRAGRAAPGCGVRHRAHEAKSGAKPIRPATAARDPTIVRLPRNTACLEFADVVRGARPFFCSSAARHGAATRRTRRRGAQRTIACARSLRKHLRGPCGVGGAAGFECGVRGGNRTSSTSAAAGARRRSVGWRNVVFAMALHHSEAEHALLRRRRRTTAVAADGRRRAPRPRDGRRRPAARRRGGAGARRRRDRLRPPLRPLPRPRVRRRWRTATVRARATEGCWRAARCWTSLSNLGGGTWRTRPCDRRVASS